MNWKLDFDYWDPYKQQRQAKKNKQGQKQGNGRFRMNSNERRIGKLIVTSSSKEKKKIYERKSNSREKKINDSKPYQYGGSNPFIGDKRDDRTRSPTSNFNYYNKRLQMIQQANGTVKKSPIKMIKKSPPKMQYPTPQMAINTIVQAPSSIASSILNNFETYPQKLLGNMTEQKLDRVFNF